MSKELSSIKKNVYKIIFSGINKDVITQNICHSVRLLIERPRIVKRRFIDKVFMKVTKTSNDSLFFVCVFLFYPRIRIHYKTNYPYSLKL